MEIRIYRSQNVGFITPAVYIQPKDSEGRRVFGISFIIFTLEIHF